MKTFMIPIVKVGVKIAVGSARSRNKPNVKR